MAYASVTYTSASGTTFALTNSSGDPIPYLRQADISVTVNGVLQVQGTDYTFNTAGTSIILTSAVSGATVIISRVTDITDATVVYTPGSTLTAQDLNNADNQIRYGLQEFSDTYGALTSGTGDLDALGGFIGSSEVWSSDNAHAATTAAIDARVDGKIDTALTTDVVAGDSITVTDNTPGSGQITIGVTNASISTAKLVDSSVTTAKIADSNVTTVKIADSNVTTAKIADANVTTAKIADSAITSAKIADGTIVAADLATDSVTTAKILDANVTTAKLADTSVTTAKLADSSVTSAKIADGTIVAGDIASDAVTTAKILDSNVTTAKIADSAVTTTKINDSAVTAVKIADGVITSAKLNASTVVTAAEQAASTPDDTSFFTTSASDGRYVNVTGDSMTGALAMGSNKITGLDTPTASGDAANKGYVDGLVAAATLADADYGDITVSGGATVWTIDNGAVTSAKIADDTIVNADINTSAAIAHSKLASITAGHVLLGNASNVPTATALSGDVTVDSSGVTAIGSGVIVDADISSSAEIAVSKLADGAARQLLQTDAAGTGVEWTDNVDIPGTLDVTGAATFDSTANIAGNLTVDTNTLYVDATNNRVGIGNNAPGNKLSVSKSGAESIDFNPGSVSNNNIILHYNWSGANYVTAETRAAAHVFAIGTSEAARIDSSSRLLIGTSTNRNNYLTQLESTGDTTLSITRNTNDNSGPQLYFAKSRGTTNNSFTAVTANDALGIIAFSGTNGGGENTAAEIRAVVDGAVSGGGANDMPGRLVFSTTADGSGSPTERLRLASGGNLFAQGVYDVTTANAANVNSASDGGLRRSTSSIKYKQSVETIEDSYSDALLQCRPVWYRSTCKDDCAEHSWWGFIAEEVAEIDPRLVHWKTTEPVVQDDGSLEHVPCDPEPEGVAYDRFVPHLLNLIKRQKEQIEAMEARLSALEGV